jgi:hypothetical protein
MLFIKSYEPEFFNYGIADWIAGLNVAAIGYKTDRWNISRIDNSFQSSGVFFLSGIDNDDEAEEAKDVLEDEFSGEDAQGKVMFIVADENDAGKFVPISVDFDADWTKLDENAITKLMVAHSWYRSLMSLPDSKGFDTERILNEWQIAKVTTIEPKQRAYLKPIKRVIKDILGLDVSDLKFINKSPVKEKKPGYMMVWEARKMDGLDYDPEDTKQQRYLAELSSRNGKKSISQ